MYQINEYSKPFYKAGIIPTVLGGKLGCSEIKHQVHSHMAFKYIHEKLNPSL